MFKTLFVMFDINKNTPGGVPFSTLGTLWPLLYYFTIVLSNLPHITVIAFITFGFLIHLI